MKITPQKQTILRLFDKKNDLKPVEIQKHTDTSRVAVHKHLRELVEAGYLKKKGSPPTVFYYRDFQPTDASDKTVIKNSELAHFLNEHYLFIDPVGKRYDGAQGFVEWFHTRRQTSSVEELAKKYEQVRSQSFAHYLNENQNLIDATAKFEDTFQKKLALDTVYFSDFYSLPQFGKTKLGSLVLYAKQSQSKALIAELIPTVQDAIDTLISKHSIEAVAFIPHSIPRTVPFLKELARSLETKKTSISLVKAYPGSIPVAQKSLKTLEERTKNARESIVVEDQVSASSVLLVDDAVGSGATLQEVAAKLKQEHGVQEVYGYAIVGSMNGFPVLTEV